MSRFDKPQTSPTVDRCGYMNDSKWRVVRDVFVARRVLCRVKLIALDYVGHAGPGAAVVSDYFEDGTPCHPRAGTVWAATPKYWDSASVGPFLSRDIDWVAVATPVFAAVCGELPANPAVVDCGGESVILGYGPPFGPRVVTDPGAG